MKRKLEKNILKNKLTSQQSAGSAESAESAVSSVSSRQSRQSAESAIGRVGSHLSQMSRQNRQNRQNRQQHEPERMKWTESASAESAVAGDREKEINRVGSGRIIIKRRHIG